MNKVILIGRLTRDPELRHTTNGTAVCSFTVAVDRMPDQNGQRQADFINVTVWNRQAENLAKYMSKGRLVAVDGRITTRNYENSEGRRVYVTEVLANTVQFLESRNSSNNSNNYNNNNSNYSSNNGYSNNNYNSSFQNDTFEEVMPFDFNSAPSEPSVSSSFGNDNSNMGNEMETMDTSKDPFESFGESIAISDNDLPF